LPEAEGPSMAITGGTDGKLIYWYFLSDSFKQSICLNSRRY
jgi:hypothetical protein